MNTRDRAFEAGVVADRADAADAGHAGAGFGRGRGNQQRRADLGQLANIARAAVLERFGGDRGDRERNVRQRFVTASRGDDDFAGVDLLPSPAPGRLDAGRFGRGASSVWLGCG